MLFMAAMALSASFSLVYRTKPKPRLRPVSRSLTTTFASQDDSSQKRFPAPADEAEERMGHDAVA